MLFIAAAYVLSVILLVGKGIFLPEPASIVAFFLPGLSVLIVLITVGVRNPSYRFAVLAGSTAAILSLASPVACYWYSWHVLNDHTANIGAGLLLFLQPVSAPLFGLGLYSVLAPRVEPSTPPV